MKIHRAIATIGIAFAALSASLWARRPATWWDVLAPDAEQLSATGRLEAAHLANPRDAAIGMRLGIEKERAGHMDASEHILLKSAHYDHQFLPAWTLANFYFRRNQADAFWQWARLAAERNPGDFRPLLQLADRIEERPEMVLKRLGSRPELLRAYLDLLLGKKHWLAAGYVGTQLARAGLSEDTPRIEALRRKLTDAGIEPPNGVSQISTRVP